MSLLDLDFLYMTQKPFPLRDPAKSAFLAWLMPGLGHYYQGRRGKAFLYAVCVLGLFFLGLALGEGKIAFWRWTSPLRDPGEFPGELPVPVLRRVACLARGDPGDVATLWD